MWNEEQFRPFPEPKGFVKHIPVLKSIEIDNYLFCVTLIQQYENCSVVNLSMDWNSEDDSASSQLPRNYFKLSLGQEYDCRMLRGGGTDGHHSSKYVVFPPLPDNLSGINLVFKI